MPLNHIPTSKEDRLHFIIDMSWRIFFEKLVHHRIKINRESSMQLHYSTILKTVGDLLCLLPGETFSLELESYHDGKNLDISCGFDGVRAAIELKCFRRASNRAQDLDMYDVWVDIGRLNELNSFQVKRFICLTDHDRYPNGEHRGYSETFSIAKDAQYKAGDILTPLWVGKWKNKSRDSSIIVPKDISFNWIEQEGWFYILLNI